ncbi:response regulator [Nitrospira moscoviensis]|uniref:histidine kinase n=1 Tax=Nitrospira moscoviensis TaxID=42253 RepID=A0A0K2GDR0_NITMO|nr:response regulator [Nitrospira moscoviensis]ALA59095.1 Histidine kinase [Nitrospira moscoviensis]
MPHLITSLTVKYEDDVVTARQRARRVAAELSFDEQDRTRIATAVSEIVRVFRHQKTLTQVEFLLEGETVPQVLIVRIAEPVQGRKQPAGSKSPAPRAAAPPPPEDWSVALQAAGRLMDQCEVQPIGGRPAIRLAKLLPKRAALFTAKAVERLGREIETHVPQNPIEEVRQQNQELLHALEQLHERQQELVRLNRELEDTNRGVVALYAELDEKAGHLRRADEMKSRFLSNMSHEFRTPLNAVLALSQLLLDRADGELTAEQEKQVRYIRKSGEDLLELVNDLLDLAKIEAGKIEVRPAPFDVATLFSALRGMLRPLLVSNEVALVFEEAEGLPPMRTDEGKVSQILRNFISNAVKFTERGEVRVRAESVDDGHAVAFSVADTGIGIAEADQERIFEEFSQIDHPIQRKVKGTGLGLPLCRKLAELLGGSVRVTSRLGAGSRFVAVIPVTYAAAAEDDGNLSEPPVVEPEADRIPVLVVEDEPETRLLYEKYLRRTVFQIIPAGSILQAREQLRRHRPAAVVLDILLPDESAWQWLAELKGREETKGIPVFIVSSVEDQRKGLALGADDYGLKPVRRDWLLERLERATGVARIAAHGPPLVLIIDDQEADRYILRRHLGGTGCVVAEAAGGEEGLALARRLKPALIVLDLNMPGADGFQVLAELQADQTMAAIPVAVVTSLAPIPDQDARLARARTVLSKNDLSAAAIRRVLEEALIGMQTAKS